MEAAPLPAMIFLPRHRRRLLLSVLLCPMLGTAAPVASSAPAGQAADGRRFLDDLARAERQHDYHALLAACAQEVAKRPDDLEAYRRRALARWGAHQYDGALEDFSRAIHLARYQKAPARTLAILRYGRALICREQHDPPAEAAELERAVCADRSFTDPLNDLAWMRATNPDASLRDGQQAVALASHACEIVPNSTKYLDTLAAAYAEAGHGKLAVDTEKAAVRAARASSQAPDQCRLFLASARARFSLYAVGGRYRDGSAKAARSAPPPTCLHRCP